MILVTECLLYVRVHSRSGDCSGSGSRWGAFVCSAQSRDMTARHLAWRSAGPASWKRFAIREKRDCIKLQSRFATRHQSIVPELGTASSRHIPFRHGLVNIRFFASFRPSTPAEAINSGVESTMAVDPSQNVHGDLVRLRSHEPVCGFAARHRRCANHSPHHKISSPMCTCCRRSAMHRCRESNCPKSQNGFSRHPRSLATRLPSTGPTSTRRRTARSFSPGSRRRAGAMSLRAMDMCGRGRRFRFSTARAMAWYGPLPSLSSAWVWGWLTSGVIGANFG